MTSRGAAPGVRAAAGRDAKAGEPDIAGSVDQDACRPDVLVNEALPVDLTERHGQRDGEVQESCQLKRPSEHPFQELASGVLAHEQRASVVAGERERSHRPRRIEFIREGIFMFEPPEICRRLLRVDRRQHQDRACIVRPPTPVQIFSLPSRSVSSTYSESSVTCGL